MKLFPTAVTKSLLFLLFSAAIFSYYGCTNSSATAEAHQAPVILPVVEIKTLPATTYREYSATIEGKMNVEIRPQVDGYIEKIFADAKLLFRSGLADYLEVITAQSNSLQPELSLADIQRQQLSAMVELYRSLGGGAK